MEKTCLICGTAESKWPTINRGGEVCSENCRTKLSLQQIKARLSTGWGPRERSGAKAHKCGYYIEEHDLVDGSWVCP